MRKIIAIVQARMGSTRLPGKVMMELEGKTVIERVFERIQKSKIINHFILATTNSYKDDELTEAIHGKKIGVFRGSEEDVLDRFYQALEGLNMHDDDIVVRITADCPLVDPLIIDKVIEKVLEPDVDYASNILPPTYPDGFDCEAFKFKALQTAWEEATLLSEREHVTPFIRKIENGFKLANLESDIDNSDIRLTLDDASDYCALVGIYSNLEDKEGFTLNDVINIIEKNPQITELNKGTIRNEGMVKSLENDKEVKK